MRIDLSELLSRPGAKQSFKVHYEGEVLSIAGTDHPVTEAPESDLEITCEKKGAALLSGRIRLTAMASCDRCLRDVPVELEAVIDQEYTDAEEGSELDTQELLYKEYLMEWPAKILCSEECRGLCQFCGADLNTGECSCPRSSLDPRMAAVLDLFEKSKKEV